MRSILSLVLAPAFMAAVTLIAFSERPLKAALIDYWPLNDGSGSIAHDTVGGLNGTLQGDAQFVAGGPTGGAISLSTATDDLINMGNVLPMTSGGDFSVVAWVDTTSTNLQVAVGKLYAGDVAGYALNISDQEQPVGTTDFYVSEGNDARYIDSSATVDDGNWHQIVGVYQAGGTSSIYVDGVFQSSQLSNTVVGDPGSFIIGGTTITGSPTGYFSGLIDGVGIYNSALTATQVQSLYATSVPEPSSIVILGVGGTGILLALRRRRKT